MKKHILLVEDDESLGFVIKDSLENNDYMVHLSTDGEIGLKDFDSKAFDLCILDVMLPKMDGFSLAEKIRQRSKMTPIIFLTAKGMQEDKLEGFKIGGDDYMTKPFSMEELIYRIEVFLRRGGASEKENTVRFLGLYSFDLNSFTLTLDDHQQKLTRREAEILQYLSDRKDTLVKREELLIALWGDDDYFKGRSLDVFISKLRKYLKFDENVDIENYHGVGFKLVVKE
ncbi:DNA-binding response regulator, OmpR family, contains REC and winged-helix (wHTH) domain [Reichenbachiella faecimaris]|uniref:DNA-binding response regulator, OmpR family, contains REC and winged-helix (WHTH) domain n=1 Tax=Reichenbachiella faecimaris TaxID=692418 RepID=A0A1W2GGP5_REIFA|nr:response regulator transcription factor [Reichenbachiella faecimaris]SMD35830.1 DNA-binding response regulator, OmpR family, contains REC and winged-helix (wHTH) domain [Reichenbachiella faecimaris]